MLSTAERDPKTINSRQYAGRILTKHLTDTITIPYLMQPKQCTIGKGGNDKLRCPNDATWRVFYKPSYIASTITEGLKAEMQKGVEMCDKHAFDTADNLRGNVTQLTRIKGAR